MVSGKSEKQQWNLNENDILIHTGGNAKKGRSTQKEKHPPKADIFTNTPDTKSQKPTERSGKKIPREET